MKMMSSFIYLQGVTNLYEFISSAEPKNKIFWRIWVTKQLMNPNHFHSME